MDRGVRVEATVPPGVAFALCVGNSRYASAPLNNSANDARDVAALCTSLGISTELLLEASLDQMLGAVNAFTEKLQRGGIALFFYAGHGVQSGDQNYLIPVEEVKEDTLLDYKALRVATVLEGMQRAGCNLNLILLDACRSKPSRMRGGSRALGRGLARISAPAGTVVAFACAPSATAADGSGRNGVFTSHLLLHLSSPGVDIDFLMGFVVEGVRKDTAGAQVPFRDSSLEGRRPCCLVEAPAEAAPAEAPLQTPASSLAAFFAHCDLEGEAAEAAATALKILGVMKKKDLALVTEADLSGLKLPPISIRKLRAGLVGVSGSMLAPRRQRLSAPQLRGQPLKNRLLLNAPLPKRQPQRIAPLRRNHTRRNALQRGQPLSNALRSSVLLLRRQPRRNELLMRRPQSCRQLPRQKSVATLWGWWQS